MFSRNSLIAFPLVITTYNLEYLDISCNLIKIVPEDVRYLKRLKVLVGILQDALVHYPCF